MNKEQENKDEADLDAGRAPFYPKDCFRLASLVYALALGKKLQRKTSWGGWATECVHIRSLARKPWVYRVAPHPINLSSNETLEFLISDAENAASENDRQNLAELTPRMIQRKHELEDLMKANKAMRRALNAFVNCGDSASERHQAKELAISALEYAKKKDTIQN